MSPSDFFFSLPALIDACFQGFFPVAVSMLMSLLFLIIVTGFKVGGGEAVSAQNQPGTPREGTLHTRSFRHHYVEITNTVGDGVKSFAQNRAFRFGA